MDSYNEGQMNDAGLHRVHRDVEEREDDEFSMSSYDGEQTDSLLIKPPQAIVQHRDKREKKDKRERHKNKGEKHKDRHKNRDRGSHEERRREHRRHRDPERKESKRHEKHKERSSKHERSGEARKLEKERKMADRDMERNRGLRIRDEFYTEVRDHYDGSHHGIRGQGASHMMYHRDRRHEDRAYGLMGLQLSPPREKTERDKRMEKFLLAERAKEITQKEADARMQRREEEKREESRMEELRMRAEASMLRHTGRDAAEDYLRKKRLHKSRIRKEPEMVEIISDEENFSVEEMEVDPKDHQKAKKKKKRKKEEEEEEEIDEIEEEKMPEVVSPKSSNSAPTSAATEAMTSNPTAPSKSLTHSDSSSSSSSSDDDEEKDDTKDSDGADKRQTSKVGEKKSNGSHSPSGGGSSSGDSTDEEKKNDSDDDRSPKHDGYMGESPVASPPELKDQLPSYYPAIMGCRSVDEFECLNRIEEGTYGVVYRAREKASNQIVALKRLKMEKEKEGFPITSLREVNTLLKGQHENIVTVREIVVGSNMDKIYIVMDYVEHDLKSLMETMRKKKQTFTIGEVKTLIIQLLRAVRHLHDNWILHRDLKTSNLLLSHRGILKVGDFGLAREYGSPLKQYTPIVVTLWYRAPELLLGTKEYSCPIDVWSCGCIFGELLGMEPMFPGKSEIDQLNKIFKDLGTPSDKIWPGYSDMPVTKKTQFAYYPYNHLKERYKTRLSLEGFKLFNAFLTYNPAKRITCSEALDHDYFHLEDPAPIATSMFPTWPAKSENPHGVRNKKGDSPKPPSGGKNFKDLGDGEDENIAGFFLGGAPSSGPGFTLKF